MQKANPAAEPVSCAIYLRVSSEEQVREGYSLTTQERLCRQKLDEIYGPDLYIATVYRDDGYPGRWGLYDPNNPRKKFRPALSQMHEAFKAGKYQVLCIYRQNRLSRKNALADFLMEDFVPYGLQRIISVREQLDLSTASGRFHMNLLSATGAYESELLGENISDAMQQRMQDGFLHRPPYGWRWQTDDEMPAGQKRPGVTRDEKQGEHVVWMANDYLAGKGLRSITQALNERGIATPRGAMQWSRASVKSIVGNPAHAGLVEIEPGEYIQAQHAEQRYYDREMFYQIKARLQRNAQMHPRRTNVPEYLLGGLIRCGHCGNRLHCQRVNRSNRRYYRCYVGQMRGKTVCTSNAKQADLVERAVLSQVRAIAQDPEVVRVADEMLEGLVEETELRLEGDLDRLEAELEDTVAKYKHWSNEQYQGRITPEEFDIHRETFLAERVKLQDQLEQTRAALASKAQREAELRQARDVLKKFDATFDGLTLEQRREMVHLLVDDAQMFHQDDGSTRITFNIRFSGQFERIIPRLTGRGTRGKGPESLTMREMEMYKLLGEGMDRGQVAKGLGIQVESLRSMLWKAQNKLGADNDDEAYEIAKDEIEANSDWLFTGRRRRRAPSDPDKPPLTSRQAEILGLKAKGLKADEIAEKLGIAPGTVYVQLDNCRHRLGRTSTETAIRHAKEMGYI